MSPRLLSALERFSEGDTQFSLLVDRGEVWWRWADRRSFEWHRLGVGAMWERR